MNNMIIIFLSVVTIIAAQIFFRKNKRIENSSVLKLLFVSIMAVLTSVFICVLLGNRFYELIIITTVCFGSIIQINYSHRISRYNASGK